VLRGGVGLPSAGVVEFVPTVSTSQAELACRWAEQRRQALEVKKNYTHHQLEAVRLDDNDNEFQPF